MQRLRNQDEVKKQAEWLIEVSFNKDCPMIPSQVWVAKPTELVAHASVVPSSDMEDETLFATVLVITYASWADEIEAAYLHA